MKIGGIDIDKTIETAQLFLEQDASISKSTKAVFTIVLTVLQLLLEKLYGDKVNMFGRKSEKAKSLPDHTKESKKSDEPAESREVTTVASHTRKKPASNNRNYDLSNFPAVTINHELPEGEHNCTCCNNLMIKIGKEVSHKLQVVPSFFYRPFNLEAQFFVA